MQKLYVFRDLKRAEGLVYPCLSVGNKWKCCFCNTEEEKDPRGVKALLLLSPKLIFLYIIPLFNAEQCGENSTSFIISATSKTKLSALSCMF